MKRRRRSPKQLTIAQLVFGIGGLFLVLVVASTLIFVARRWDDDRRARDELSGLSASAAIMSLAHLTAEHRGMSSGVLAGGAGDARSGAMRSAKQTEVDGVFQQTLDSTRSWETPRIAHLRDGLDAEWTALCHEV